METGTRTVAAKVLSERRAVRAKPFGRRKSDTSLQVSLALRLRKVVPRQPVGSLSFLALQLCENHKCDRFRTARKDQRGSQEGKKGSHVAGARLIP